LPLPPRDLELNLPLLEWKGEDTSCYVAHPFNKLKKKKKIKNKKERNTKKIISKHASGLTLLLRDPPL
jgi:hypothetical protein